MKRLDKIAMRVAMPVMLKKQLKNLADLADLSSNIDDMVDMFGMHFRIAKIDTDIDNQLMLLKKAQNGFKAAQETQRYLEMVLREYPDDKTALRATKDAAVMVKRFERHEKDARKVISIISKKEMPADLSKYALSIARAMRAMLEDPKALRVVPWQQKHYQGGILYQMVIIVPTPGADQKEYRVMVQEDTSSADGPSVYRMDGRPTPKKMAERMAESLKGWPGLKGEGSAIAGREQTARAVAEALNSAISRMNAWMQEDAEVSTGNAEVHAMYRSDLPKDGAQAVGESQYDIMVEEEIKRFKKQLDPLLKPYMKAIRKVRFYDSEKSWIEARVYLK